MDGRNMKRDARQPGVGEIHQPLAHRRFVKKFELLFFCRRANAHTGGGAEFVKFRQAVGRENLEDGEAAVAAKDFVLLHESRVPTKRAAVKARRGLSCGVLIRPRVGAGRRRNFNVVGRFCHSVLNLRTFSSSALRRPRAKLGLSLTQPILGGRAAGVFTRAG